MDYKKIQEWLVCAVISSLLALCFQGYKQCNNELNCKHSMDSFVCENSGIRMYSKKNGFSCSCTPDYGGKHCQTKKPMSFSTSVLSRVGLGNSNVSRGKPTMWRNIFSGRVTWGRQLETNYAIHQSVVKSLENVIADAVDDGYAARILLPARPLECCAIDENIPPQKKLYDDIFKRKHFQFIPDRKNRNLLYSAFSQYFVLQFFDADSNLKITASQLYGNDPVSERHMRSFSCGKLKTMEFNNKHNAPNQAINAFTKRISTDGSSMGLFCCGKLKMPQFKDKYNAPKQAIKAFANRISIVGSWLSDIITQIFKPTKMLSTSPMLFVLSTLWVREHNRVCDELSRKWSSWTDDELYTTARKITTGQMMNIMMNEILKVDLSPEVYHHRLENIYSSGTPIELYLTIAVSSLPENLQNGSTKLTSFSNTRQVSETDLENDLKCMVKLNMGMVTAHNDGALTEQLTKTLIDLSRIHRLQGFNNYRRQLGLPAYNSFLDLTGNVKTAIELEKLYTTVEDVELLTGVLTEKSSSKALPTVEVLTNSFIVNAILTNDLTTIHSWVPDTFGGFEFFTLVKSACLETLVCRNLDICDELQVSLYTK